MPAFVPIEPSLRPTVDLTDGAAIYTNASLGDVFAVTIAGNRTMMNPTGLTPGQLITYQITQDASGGRTITWGDDFRFNDAFPQPVLSESPDAVDHISFRYNDVAGRLECVALAIFERPGITTTFQHTGAGVDYVVPAGVTEVMVKLFGAEGATAGAAGGKGGLVRCLLTVTPEETLKVFVGGPGSGATGGYNGGGPAGAAGNGWYPSGGGGGATDVRRTPYALADRLVIAGGGGGGGNARNTAAVGIGGAGGGLLGVAGTSGSTGGGGGGTQAAGGSSGGALGVGGTGPPDTGNGGTNYGASGAGGGGGFYGGGASGGTSIGQSAGGGGGGSGKSTGVNETIESGVRSGAGLATITYYE